MLNYNCKDILTVLHHSLCRNHHQPTLSEPVCIKTTVHHWYHPPLVALCRLSYSFSVYHRPAAHWLACHLDTRATTTLAVPLSPSLLKPMAPVPLCVVAYCRLNGDRRLASDPPHNSPMHTLASLHRSKLHVPSCTFRDRLCLIARCLCLLPLTLPWRVLSVLDRPFVGLSVI